MIVLRPDELLPVQALSHYQIIRRNGVIVPFEPSKIAIAMMKTFLAVKRSQRGKGSTGSWLLEVMQTLEARLSLWRQQARLRQTISNEPHRFTKPGLSAVLVFLLVSSLAGTAAFSRRQSRICTTRLERLRF